MASIIEIFFCFAREDEELLKELEKHLSPFKRQGIIDVWHNGKIIPGTERTGDINNHLDSAHIILLLVSPDFIDSDYCYGTEMKRAMERHERGDAYVIPVILRPIQWQDAPFGKLQALPRDEKPVVSWSSREEAFDNIAKGIGNTIQQLFNRKAKPLVMDNAPPTPFRAQTPPIGDIPVGVQARKKQLLEEGFRFINAKKYPEALAKYEQALLLDPNDDVAIVTAPIF